MEYKNGYTITRSNYTLKRKLKTVGNTSIYERDYMAPTNNSGWDGLTFPNSQNNFKFVTNRKPNGMRSTCRNEWLRNESGNDYWTLDDACAQPSTESSIILNPNYSSLLDFVYYGNCEEFIKNTISNIINTYPAEFYFSSKQKIYITENGEEEKKLGGNNSYLIDNPFNIDIISQTITDKNANKLRYFCESISKYCVYNDNKAKIGCLKNWNVQVNNDRKCPKNGDKLTTITFEVYSADNTSIYNVVIEEYYCDGETFLTYKNDTLKNLHVRPHEEVVENFFTNLENGGKLLLNRKSNVLYTATLDYPHNIKSGIGTYKKTFTWPTLYGWNLDIESSLYVTYLSELLKLCRYYDENNTDNLWSMMVHDSISNMDLPFSNQKLDEDSDDYQLGTTRLQSLLWSYGRNFDELKQQIKNIKSVNIITYDINNNTPDYFLTDSLNLQGWEVTSVINGICFKGETKDLISNKEHTLNELNTQFLRNLRINSKDILRRKGTKYAIEMILGLFGMQSKTFVENYNKNNNSSGETYYDYSIDEYDTVAKPSNRWQKLSIEEGDEILDIEKYNFLTSNFPTSETNSMYKIPATIVYTIIDDKEYKYYVPWFNKNTDYNGNTYFQMYGGWGKRLSKKINLTKRIFSNSDVKIYEETNKYIGVVENISDLKNIPISKLHNNDVYYVYDISNIEYYFKGISQSEKSNYFYLKDKNNVGIIGDKEITSDITQEGWKPISKTSTRVLYMESLFDDYSGNGPHCGYGNYDQGERYVECINNLLKYNIENDLFEDGAYECETGKLLSGITQNDFNLVKQIDNVKCWYFTDTRKKELDKNIGDGNSKQLYEFEKEIVGGNTKYKPITMEPNKVGKDAQGYFYNSNLEPYNYEIESGATYDEAAANSIVNVKNIVINFYRRKGSEKIYNDLREYIVNNIYPYIKQVIPSTTIVEFKIEDEGAEIS